MNAAIRFGSSPDTEHDGDSQPKSQAITSNNEFSKTMSERDIVFTQAYGRHEMLRLGYPLDPTQLSFVATPDSASREFLERRSAHERESIALIRRQGGILYQDRLWPLPT